MRSIFRWFAVLVASALGAAVGPLPASAQASQNLWNAKSDWCLESQNQANVEVFMSECISGQREQKWVLVPAAGGHPNDYLIKPENDTGLCLDQHYSTSGPTTLLRAWQCTGVLNQRWIISVGPTANTIMNARSVWCLDQSHADNNTVPTSTVVAWPRCHLQDNQQWFNGVR
ncbi:RICIN domain-containing protein [Actinoplanes siamensis]|uniref:Ricin B lectin domain-containing protein n=1 Tax=Actinoplanes siamensis TaxID=1223317 RepID=A0A919N5I5_9ACTN|nr:RICIN domain-containing protein [Actinoplanes siamensis]GIF04828.1 hypothetical protein Asi03nite_23660 [Actinoplanes siamensis]